MIKSKETQKRFNLKTLINSLKPLKLEFGQLPTIKQNQQRVQNKYKENCDKSEKIFINSQEALILINKDFDRKTKHDLLQMIKKKAEKQLSINNESYNHKAQKSTKKIRSLNLRKHSLSSRSINNVGLKQYSQYNLDDIKQINYNKGRKNSNPFLSIQVLQANPQKKRSSVSVRIRTERNNNQVMNHQNIDNQKQISYRPRFKRGFKKEKIYINAKKFKTLQESLSFRPQNIGPW